MATNKQTRRRNNRQQHCLTLNTKLFQWFTYCFGLALFHSLSFLYGNIEDQHWTPTFNIEDQIVSVIYLLLWPCPFSFSFFPLPSLYLLFFVKIKCFFRFSAQLIQAFHYKIHSYVIAICQILSRKFVRSRI